MKKVLLLLLTLMLLASSISASAVALEVDGVQVDSNMIFTDSTAYVPVSSIAKAMGKRVDFDAKSQSVFVNGINLFPEKSDEAKVYIDGKKYTPSDTASLPIVQNGEVYLPAHLAAEAFGKTAVWYKDTATLVLTSVSPEKPNTVIDPNKTYAIINGATGQALSAGDNSLSALDFTKAANQEFKFIATEFEGYYNIQSVQTGKNLDVNAHGTTPGVSIITWDMGTGDNQKFTIEDVPGGTLISARSCHLPIEPNGTGVMQNTRTEADKQKWQIVEFNSYKKPEPKKAVKLEIEYVPPVAEEVPENAPYRTFTMDGVILSDSDGLKMTLPDYSDNQKWTLIENSEGVYVIENLATAKSVDVNARSLEAGASIITWQTSQDTNQRWILEKNGDGTYYIKSAHSDLYLTVTDENTLVQQPKDMAFKQRWTMTAIN